MKNSILTSSLFALLFICVLSSCTKEEEPMISHDMLSDLERAELFLSSHSVPAILFSYDILDTEANVLTRYVIDNEGKIRMQTNQATSARSTSRLSDVALGVLRRDSDPVEDMTVPLDELVQNFNLLRTADPMDYDLEAEQDESSSKVLTAMYGYYFDANPSTSTTTSTNSSSSSSNECGNGSSSTTTTTSTTTGSSYRAVLLEQRLNGDVIQSNLGAKYTANWLSEINASFQQVSGSK